MIIITQAIILWSVALFILGLDLVLLLGSKHYSSRIFAILTFSTALWVTSYGFFMSSLSADIPNLLIRFQYVIGMIISVGFYHFSYIYPSERKPSQKSLIISLLLIVGFCYLYFFTNTMITGIIPVQSLSRWTWVSGPLQWIFNVTFCALWVIILRNLYRNYRSASGTLRINIRNIFIALFLGIIPPTLLSILLPSLGYYSLDWLGPISSLIWISITTYSILKHHLFNIKVIAVQIITFSLWIFILIRVILAETTKDLIIQSSLFVITVLFGIFLIRSVLHEITQREKIEKLAADLKVAYMHVKDVNENLAEKVAAQTADVRRAFEVEKRARTELEQLNKTKDQFITSTQHHLRTPLTSLKWELESIRKGDRGPVSEDLRQALDTTDASVKNLDAIIEDFIQITERKN